MAKTKKKVYSTLLAILGLTAANLLFFLTIWLASKYDKVSLDQFIYQMKSSAAGANRSIANSAVVHVGLFGLGATAVQLLLYMVCSGKFQKQLERNIYYIRLRSSKLCHFITQRAIPLVLAILLVSVSFFTMKLGVISYAADMVTDSEFIEAHYVSPEDVTITFPENKRNLIYIFLESMEVTFSDTTAGDPIYENYIPELTQLAKENINFSHTTGVGGAFSYTGTTWTAAALVAQTSGTIVQVPLLADRFGGENKYMPGLISLGELLQEAGYQQTLLFGSDADFGGRESYFTDHGEYNIVDIRSLKEQGRLPEDYLEWWGFEDEKLFTFAREEVLKLAESGEPFNFTMLTADTHFPDGYVCQLCMDGYEDQYANVMRCSSRQVYEFVSWLKSQPFYENTTIVISGDHLTMDPDYLKDIDEDYVRTVYNCIINAPSAPLYEKERKFGTYDMFPTTLAALGVEIEGDRLGLGTNLFSAQPTLTEMYGFAVVDEEFQKNSDFYNDTLLEMGKRQEQTPKSVPVTQAE